MSGGVDGTDPAAKTRLPVVPNESSGNDAIAPVIRTRLPAAAAPSRNPHLSNLYVLTLLSAIDGSLVLLAAAGQLSTLGGALTIGLTVVAGAGSWLAAHQAFGARLRTRRDWAALAIFAAVTVAATVASVAVGAGLGKAVTLHVLPKAAGVVLLLVAAEVAGWRAPRPARVPLPLWVVGAAVVVEVATQWIP